ncbi:putative structural maintenance of chromosomes protein 6 [Cercophora samala]|uniref:Structural maintenance of chromosomes protein 6 n=1 Tax=Cercophora samala TaxID=330535 RepID=A0AA39ZFM3_9PEZI|nr:putative structural maintenance of chromosomes protein 6 [Cercophora samala]
MPARTINNLGAESSRKRHHHGEDEEAEEPVPSRSHLNVDSRKRVRLSDVRDETPAADPHDEPEYQAPASPNSPPRTQYELMRDNGFEHLQNEVADDHKATQRLRMRPNRLGENVVAENGILELVECINFMCHTRLHCKLGPLLNFIVGENGSGKSAILTAITLCLGGKASSTNRGGALKDFVKEGTERAILRVQIKNQGVDAFKHDVYGDSITVERHFTKTGNSGNGFKVKTATGAVHSTKKTEVEEIVEYYALQVDNPLNVLSQDNARQFLNASTKAQKYKFFIEGVQLQQLDNDYKLVAESLSQTEAKIPDLEQQVELAKAEKAKAERLLETLEGERSLREKINTMRLKLAWSRVDTCEKRLEQKQAKLAELSSKLTPAEQDVNLKTQALDQADRELETAKAKLERAKEEEPDLQTKVEEAKVHYDAMVADLIQVQAEEREAHQNWKAVADQVKDFGRKIAEEERRIQAAHGGAQAQKIKDRDEAQARAHDLQQKIDSKRQQVPHIERQINDSARALIPIKERVTNKQKEIEAVKREITKTQQQLGEPLAAYDRNMPKLLKAIEDDKRFQHKPIGPLGTVVHLHKPEWGAILETYFGNSLNGFVVYSKTDMNVLADLMRRCSVDSNRSPIFVGQRNPLNLAGKEPDGEFDTILRVLKIDNQAVRDTLVINHTIEQVLLIPKRTAAQTVMIDGPAPPRNVKRCITFHDSKNEGLSIERKPSGISTGPVRMWNQSKRLKTESASQVAFLKESLLKLESELQALRVEYRRVQDENSHHKTELAKTKKEADDLARQLQQTELEIAEIEVALDEWDGSDARLQSLREQLAQAQEQKTHHGEQVTGLVLAKDQKNGLAEEARKALKAQKLQLKDCEARVRKAEEKAKSAEDNRRILVTHKNDSITAYNLLKAEQQEIEESIGRENDRIAGKQADAIKVCAERVYLLEGETEMSINTQYFALRARYDKMINRRQLNEAQVIDQAEKARQKYTETVSILNSIVEYNERMRKSLSQRLDKWRKFQRYISSQSRANFIYLLSERGYRGKLLLDHKRRLLDVQVEPDKTEKRASGRSTKTLSGGEKSFSSICLLLSIWEAMGSPLRCLDEFDVFMDNVNRAVSQNMLVTAARKSVNRQYIFITPNAIDSKIALEKDVRLIRLTDPRQQRLTDNMASTS